MALSTGLASGLAGSVKKSGTSGALGASGPDTPGPGGAVVHGIPTGVAGSPTYGYNPAPGTPSPTAAPSAPNPVADAQIKAYDYTNRFNLAQALSAIQDAPNQAGLQRQSDYYGMLAGLMGQDPTAGYARAQAGLQGALLGINQQQLGYDANTLRAQQQYTNSLYGQAGQSYLQTIAFLSKLSGANTKEYNEHIGNFATILQSARAALAANISGANLQSQQSQGNYRSDATARGAWGAKGTGTTLGNMANQLTQQLTQLRQAGKQNDATIANEKSRFVKAFQTEQAQITNQGQQNQHDYTKAGLDKTERLQEISDALAKNALEIQADNIRKQQAANQAAGTGAQARWTDAINSLQYQNEQANINAQIADSRQRSLYNATQIMPYLKDTNGYNPLQFLQQQQFRAQDMIGLPPSAIHNIALAFNTLNMTMPDYRALGFTPNQVAIYGFKPAVAPRYQPGSSVGTGSGRAS